LGPQLEHHHVNNRKTEQEKKRAYIQNIKRGMNAATQNARSIIESVICSEIATIAGLEVRTGCKGEPTMLGVL
jgi:hypothetical protein